MVDPIGFSTIGLGDITPTQPKYLLVHFMYIIIGLSLVSMCINLIQAKLERTYEAGGEHRFNDDEFDKKGGLLLEAGGKIKRRGSSLGRVSGCDSRTTSRRVSYILFRSFVDKRNRSSCTVRETENQQNMPDHIIVSISEQY